LWGKEPVWGKSHSKREKKKTTAKKVCSKVETEKDLEEI